MINGLYSRSAAFAVALVALALAMAPAAHAQGKWRAGTPIPQGANEVIGAEIDGQVLVYGGQDHGNNAMGIFWKFDPAKSEWSKLPSNPVPVHHGASASIGHKFYVFGGFRLPDTGKAGWYPENKAWMFDLDTQKWSALPPMPYVDGKLYAIGGRVGSCYSGGWSSNVWMNEAYDIATNTWATRAPMPTARSGTGIAALDGKIYVLGGEGWVDDFGGVFRANEVYDPNTNTWSRAARMITPRHGFAVAQVGKTIYAVSGVNNAGGAGTLSVVPVNEIYEP